MTVDIKPEECPVTRACALRAGSLLDAAQALLNEGYAGRAAELIAEARAEVARVGGETPGSQASVPSGGVPVMLCTGPRPHRFACPECQATVFTRHGDEYACDGCGARYQGVKAA